MGKTWKDSEESGRRPVRKINTHRDLPDLQDKDLYDENGYPYDDEEAENYYGQGIQIKRKPSSN